MPKRASGWERVSREEALTWWKRPPLLFGDGKLKYGQAHEDIFLVGGERGRDCNQDTGICRIFASYGYPPNTFDKLVQYDFMDERGVYIMVTVYPRMYGKVIEPTGEAVVVRGHGAVHEFFFKGDGSNVDRRSIEWLEATPDGATLYWEVGVSPKWYSKEDAIAFVDALTPSS